MLFDAVIEADSMQRVLANPETDGVVVVVKGHVLVDTLLQFPEVCKFIKVDQFVFLGTEEPHL